MTLDGAKAIFPTDWHTIDAITGIECRQLTEDTYQLRSPSHSLTVNKEGFDLYRDDTAAGHAIFEDWCHRNNIVAVQRTLRDVEGADDFD